MKQLLIPALAAAALASCVSKSGPAGETSCYNLDFEYVSPDTGGPMHWNSYAVGYEVSADTAERHCGRTSLRAVQRDTTGNGGAFFNQILPVDAAGREVCLTGWVRTEGVGDGLASIWIGGDDNAEWDPADPSYPSVTGTSGWTQITTRARLSDSAQLILAAVLMGEGTAWFDDFHVTIDGVPLVDSLVPAPKSVLTRAEKRALRKYVHPLRTWEPDGGGTEDLEAVGRLVGNASVVGLGEATHGSREIFRMKDRLIRYLAANEGFDIFSIEANMPESYAVGDYVAAGTGDARESIAGMYFWTWNTEAMLGLTEWMRGWNAAGHRMAYTGVDMQYYAGSLRILGRAFAGDAAAQRQIGTLTGVLDAVAAASARDYYAEPGPQQLRRAEELLGRLETRIDALPDETAARCEVPAGGSGRAWLRQQVELIRQYLVLHSGPMNERFQARDRFMAENLLWIREQNPASRIVAWAHNAHVQNESGCMGGYLKERLGDDYVTFGFAFYDGGYTAYSQESSGLVLGPQEARTAYPGTLEYLLEQLGEPVFLLDLKAMREAHDPALAWIGKAKFRSVGAVRPVSEFFPDSRVPEVFDYLIFIRHTTPSRLLSKKN